MKKQNKSPSLPVTAAIGGAAAMAIAMLLSLILAWLAMKNIIKQQALAKAVPYIIAGSVFLGTLLTAHRLPKSLAAVSALGSTAIYCIICLVIKWTVFRGSYQFFLRNVLIMLAACGASIIVFHMMHSKKKKASRRRR